MAKAVDPHQEYARALTRVRGMRRKFVEMLLFGKTAGNIEGSARASGYAEGSVMSIHSVMPKRRDVDAFAAGDYDHLTPVVLAILWGQRCKALEQEKAEAGRAAQRIALNITPDLVVRRLKEIGERCAGYDVEPDTVERKGAFDPAKFQPGSAQRAFELLGKDAGMFVRKEGPVKKTFDEMTMEELDEAMAAIEAEIADLEARTKKPAAPAKKGSKFVH